MIVSDEKLRMWTEAVVAYFKAESRIPRYITTERISLDMDSRLINPKSKLYPLEYNAGVVTTVK